MLALEVVHIYPLCTQIYSICRVVQADEKSASDAEESEGESENETIVL